ncbi:MAG: 50S ribosomal protein L21 [Candidatus Limnocylindria bacterium]
MYAVVTTGGKQYRVEAGSTLSVERLAGEPGASITFDRVLLVADGEDVTIGTPIVAGASVSGTVIGEERGPKLVIFKFKQKVKYRRRTGHRQHLTRVRIDAINADGKPKASAKAADKPKAARAASARKPATSKAAAGPAPTRKAAPKKAQAKE